MRTKKICVDFDGVIADYSQGFQRTGVYGEPVPGCARALQCLRDDGWHIIVCTARRDAEMPHIERYLDKYGIPYDKVTGRKPGAHAYVDDRAIRFDGKWWSTFLDIKNFEPYEHRKETGMGERPEVLEEKMVALESRLQTIWTYLTEEVFKTEEHQNDIIDRLFDLASRSLRLAEEIEDKIRQLAEQRGDS